MMNKIIKVFSDPAYDLDSNQKVDLFGALIDILEDQDCDTLHECLGQSIYFDMAFNARYPQEE